jgi:hypothetical protein
MVRLSALAGLLLVVPLQTPPSAPQEIRVYVADERKRPHSLEGWEAVLEIGDRLDGSQRELLPMQLVRPRGAEKADPGQRSQIRPIDGTPWTAEMVVIQPVSPDPFAGEAARPYFKADYAPGARFKPEWAASVTFLVKSEVKTARNFRYPFLEATGASADGRTVGAALPLD